MAIAIGSLITAAEYNALATLINKVYDDIYSGATPVEPVANASTIANYKFGWGGTAVTAVSIGELITDEQLNNIICRANIGVDITNNTPTNLTYVDQHMLITAADWTTVDAVLDLGRRISAGEGAGLMAGKGRIQGAIPYATRQEAGWVTLQKRYLAYLNMAEAFEEPGKVRRAIKLKV